MVQRRFSTSPPPKWAYAYEIVPPQAKDRLHMIKTLLDQHCADARIAARTWEGRMIAEEHVTHILVVSDTPDQTGEINRRIEKALKTIKAGFAVTVPMPVAESDTTQLSETRE